MEWGSPPFSDNAWHFLDREVTSPSATWLSGENALSYGYQALIWNIMIWLVVWNMNGLSIYWECHHPN